jgi:hypothetical protein
MEENTIMAGNVRLQFLPVAKLKRYHCNHCWLLKVHTELCETAACGVNTKRSDGKIGVFTIQEMPKKSSLPIDRRGISGA